MPNTLRKIGLTAGFASPRNPEEEAYIRATWIKDPTSAEPLPDSIWEGAGTWAQEDPDSFYDMCERTAEGFRNGPPQETIDLLRRVGGPATAAAVQRFEQQYPGKYV